MIEVLVTVKVVLSGDQLRPHLEMAEAIVAEALDYYPYVNTFGVDQPEAHVVATQRLYA